MELCSSVSFKRSKITVSLYANGNGSIETNKKRNFMCKEKQESYDKPRQCVKKQRRHFAGKSP